MTVQYLEIVFLDFEYWPKNLKNEELAFDKL